MAVVQFNIRAVIIHSDNFPNYEECIRQAIRSEKDPPDAHQIESYEYFDASLKNRVLIKSEDS